MELAGAIALSVLSDLISPIIVVPALALGWIMHRWRQAAAAAVLIGLVSFVISLASGALPKGAEIVWPAVPSVVAAPLAWCSAAFLGRRWWDGRASERQRRLARRIAALVAGAALGGGLGAALGLGLGTLYVALGKVSDFEGLAGHLVFLGFVPASIVTGTAAGLIAACWWQKRPARR